jgi:hypothetical protein
MSRAADRHREQEADLDPDNGNVRPNVPPTPVNEANRCAGAKYGEHDYSSIHHDDPRGSGIMTARCWYCSRLSPASANRVAQWEQEQEAKKAGRR